MDQSLISINGTFIDEIMGQNGTATYYYYEDENTHKNIKHGSFSYTFNGVEDYKGFNQTIKGNYKNGLKDDLWTYTLLFTDFNIENGLVLLAATNKYTIGKIILTANYKDGYAHGVWKTNWSYKKRSKDYYSREWLPFEAQKSLAIEMNFANGYFVGKVNNKNDFSPFEVLGKFDQNSLATGTGVWQKWRFSAPQTVLWLIKHLLSASIPKLRDVKIATFAKRQNVMGKAIRMTVNFN
jgi:hypothetical protein